MIHILATRPNALAAARQRGSARDGRLSVGRPPRPLTAASRLAEPALARRLPHAPARQSLPHRWLIAPTLLLALLVGLLEMDLLQASLPDLARQVPLPPSTIPWLLLGACLAGALVPLLTCRLAEQVGRNRMVVLALALFGSGALLVAYVPSLAALLSGRALETLGVWALAAVGVALLKEAFAQKSGAAALWTSVLGYTLSSAWLLGHLSAQMPRASLLPPALAHLAETTNPTLSVSLLFLLSAGGLLLLLLRLHPAPPRPFAPSAAWQHCYWFSGAGTISAERILHFLRVHPGWKHVALPPWGRRSSQALRASRRARMEALGLNGWYTTGVRSRKEYF